MTYIKYRSAPLTSSPISTPNCIEDLFDSCKLQVQGAEIIALCFWGSEMSITGKSDIGHQPNSANTGLHASIVAYMHFQSALLPDMT